ncbi:MAG: hypothetical protein QNJ53_04700 [Pleurocapsa sp. MO_192.B19]|nr:hypothetical protein [Pleurocapsa sp. MO_192.B19]
MEGQGAKIGSTAIIWGLATGMMAISIPIVKMTQTGIILPLAVVIGVSLSTIAIWLSTWLT